MSLATFLASFPDEEACWSYVFYHRHRLRPRCQRCGVVADWTLATTRRGYWSSCCSALRSVTGGSIFHHCRLPLRTWFYVALLVADLPMGASVAFVGRQLGISHKAAWRMVDALRLQMAALELPRKVGGSGRRVHCDETLLRISGRPVSLFGATDGDNLALRIVPDRSRRSLLPIIEQCVLPGSIIVTDNYPTYRSLPESGWDHRRVNHSSNGWMNAEGDCNAPIERVWSALKRQLSGATGQIEDEKLWKFIKDFLFRYHSRRAPDEVFWRLVSSYPPEERYDQAMLRAEVDARVRGIVGGHLARGDTWSDNRQATQS